MLHNKGESKLYCHQPTLNETEPQEEEYLIPFLMCFLFLRLLKAFPKSLHYFRPINFYFSSYFGPKKLKTMLTFGTKKFHYISDKNIRIPASLFCISTVLFS